MKEIDNEDEKDDNKKESLLDKNSGARMPNSFGIDVTNTIKKSQQNKEEIPNIDIDYYGSANCLSSLFYYWAFKIIKLSHKVKISIQHVHYLFLMFNEYKSITIS